MEKKLMTRIGGIAIIVGLISFAVLQCTQAVSAGASHVVQTGQTGQADKPFDQDQALSNLRQAIAGKEEKPASEVFKNIQVLKGMPAGRLLRVMELGYAKSLGVSCTHCHVAGEWEKEDKPTKQVTRDMMAMVATINNDLLKKIKNLKSAAPIVNCTTCHRGQVKPELNLPDKPKS